MVAFRKTTELKIGDKEFIITHWSPTKVMKNLPKIGRYFAVPMATVAGSVMAGGANFSDALPTAALYLFEQMEEDDIIKLIDLLLEDVDYNSMGAKINIDEVFDGDIMGMIQLVTKVLEVNYGCFFEKSGFVNLQGLMEKMGMVRSVDQMGQDPKTADI